MFKKTKCVKFTMDELLLIWHKLNVPVNMTFKEYAKTQDSKVIKIKSECNINLWCKIDRRVGKYCDIVKYKSYPIKVEYNGENCEEI